MQLEKFIPEAYIINNKIQLPRHITHVNIDIGLSFNAPVSYEWLKNNSNLIVFGFEPNWAKAKVLSIFPNNLMGEKGFFKMQEINITQTLIGVLFIIGGLLIMFSKEKIEDHIVEMIASNLTEEWNYINYVNGEEVKFFKDNPLDEFPNMKDKFLSIKGGAHRADLFRYYYLYVKGGVFIDSDAMIEQDINIIAKDGPIKHIFIPR